jgi:hypothetical protein
MIHLALQDHNIDLQLVHSQNQPHPDLMMMTWAIVEGLQHLLLRRTCFSYSPSSIPHTHFAFLTEVTDTTTQKVPVLALALVETTTSSLV